MATASRIFVQSLIRKAQVCACVSFFLTGVAGGIIFHWQDWVNGWLTLPCILLLFPLMIFHPVAVEGSKLRPKLLSLWMIPIGIVGFITGKHYSSLLRDITIYIGLAVILTIFEILFVWYAKKVSGCLDDDSVAWVTREYS